MFSKILYKHNYLIILLFFLFAQTAGARNAYWQDSLRYEIDSLITSPYFTQVRQKTVVRRKRKKHSVWKTVSAKRNFVVGCCIYDLTDDLLLYAHNDTKLMIPASTQKLYVALAMIKNMGRDHSLVSKVTVDGKQQEDSLGRKYWDGSIYYNSIGNPALSADDVMAASSWIESLGCDSINGKIVLCQTDKSRRVKSGDTKFVMDIAGSLADKGMCFTSMKPWETITGRPDGKQKIVCRLSTPVSAILPRMLKNSNNAYAESLFVNLIDDGDDWSYDGCKDVVRDMVRSIRRKYHPSAETNGGLADYYVIADGSGLSKQNRTTAQSQVDLLRYTYSSKKLFRPLYEYLPIAGVDGTLSKRMTESSSCGNVRAKTGTVNNVSTLSGYAQTSNGHKIAFSILINDCPDASFARSLQDKICDVITR